ncbi:MAG TPA: protein-methionine-sulfoxide reductase catalytic subunit MsrP [Methylomirabilota bacterium]|nr:protein-methionine-sulfoxide reductase catalytic subunit MsrP [Methylomirabilota bacterium]
MPNIIMRRSWQLTERLVIPEAIFNNRRAFLKQTGFAGGALLSANPLLTAADATLRKGYPYPRNGEFDPKWKLTDERVAGSYNNFYEFSLQKDRVKDLVGGFVTSPWHIEIKGLVEKPLTLDLAELIDTMPLEERIYRFRCVEAWAMIVPWTGFPLSKLIEKVKPKAEAKFLRFETANRPDQMPGMRSPQTAHYPWPYFEGLRMDEAMHPLTLLATGIYGKPMAKQYGAPARIVVPWKYGYKSIKSIVKIEFIDKQPKTFWEMLAADEYPFESNVNPAVPHPRWSQATERMIDTGDRVRTQPYNGYGNLVAKLYKR